MNVHKTTHRAGNCQGSQGDKEEKVVHQRPRGAGARPGRPPLRGEAKQRLTLSITPMARHYLDRMARHEQMSISELVDSWTEGMMTTHHPLQPLGRGSRRKGKLVIRKQPLHYDECKVQLNLKVTPATKRGLQQLATEACDIGTRASISDIVERWVISAAEYIDLMAAIEVRERAICEDSLGV